MSFLATDNNKNYSALQPEAIEMSLFSSPYDGKWSKTMIGYGSEDHHFVVELTYNYGIGEYRLGNDFLVWNILFHPFSKMFGNGGLLEMVFFFKHYRTLFY